MKSRWLSTFTLIGILLLALGIGGLILQYTGRHFVFDPGQPPPASGQDYTPWYYLVIGALMVLNGIVTPPPVPDEAPAPKSVSTNGTSAPAPRPSTGQEVIVTSAEKIGE